MQADTVVALMESADTAMDTITDESTLDLPLEDWKWIFNYVGGNEGSEISWFTLKFGQFPEIGPYIRKRAYNKLSLHYDILVNYVECHEKTQKQIA
jgi:hypothetical protein